MTGGMAAADAAAGIAGWLIWRQPDGRRQYHAAFTYWAWQLGFSAVWAPLLFGLQIFTPALAATILMTGAAALCAVNFRALNTPATLLMLPVCAWALFCTYLMAGFWWLNQ
jgi:tryptophan-rich sensory protein